MLQFMPGTDFIFSGYAAEPNYDNMFAGSNFDAEDFDDYNVMQRDMQVDGGLRPVTEGGSYPGSPGGRKSRAGSLQISWSHGDHRRAGGGSYLRPRKQGYLKP